MQMSVTPESPRSYRHFMVIMGFFSLGSLACEEEPPAPPDTPIADMQAVFASSCAGGACHIDYAAQPAGGLALTPGSECLQLVGIPSLELPDMVRVEPGDVAASYLYCKLDPDCASRPVGATLMPLGWPDGLPAEELAVVARWIEDSAFECIDEQAPMFAGLTEATPLPSGIQLSWQPASDDMTPAELISYLIYQADTSGGQNFAEPTYETAPGDTTFTATGMPVDTTFYFVARARDAAGNIEGNTIEVIATTPATGDIEPPTFIGVQAAMPIGDSAVNLTWQAATDDASPANEIVYRVYAATTSGGQEFAAPALLETDPGAVEALISGLDPASDYFFVVRSVDTAGNEDTNTVELSATTNGVIGFAADILPIFAASCASASCHGGAMPSQGLDLGAQAAYEALVDIPSTQCSERPLVVPSQPEASYLVNKITGMDICQGSQMPKVGSLPPSEQQLILNWISAGAPNN